MSMFVQARWIVTLVMVLGACAVEASAVTLYDPNFVISDWTVDTTTGGQTATQIASDGNSGTSPDPYWRVTTTSSISAKTYFFNDDLTINPSVTEILSLDWTIDVRKDEGSTGQMDFGLALRQGGFTFVWDKTLVRSGVSQTWNTRTFEDLTAADFKRTDQPSFKPDFDGGGAITFGFFTSISNGEGVTVGFDNYTIDGEVVPEPTSLALAGAGLLALLKRRR